MIFAFLMVAFESSFLSDLYEDFKARTKPEKRNAEAGTPTCY